MGRQCVGWVSDSRGAGVKGIDYTGVWRGLSPLRGRRSRRWRPGQAALQAEVVYDGDAWLSDGGAVRRHWDRDLSVGAPRRPEPVLWRAHRLQLRQPPGVGPVEPRWRAGDDGDWRAAAGRGGRAAPGRRAAGDVRLGSHRGHANDAAGDDGLAVLLHAAAGAGERDGARTDAGAPGLVLVRAGAGRVGAPDRRDAGALPKPARGTGHPL